MKQLLLLIFVATTALSLSAQSNDIDERLLEKYTKAELTAIQQNNPEEFKYINYCIENAWYLTEIPKEKIERNEGRFGKVKIEDIEHINFFALDIEITANDYQFFVIDGTEKVLVIKSKAHILRGLKL